METDTQSTDLAHGVFYGGCYTITNQAGEKLGHMKNSPWAYLEFGERATTFRICDNLGDCTIEHKEDQQLRDRARFWLFDTEGNDYEKDGSFIAANSAPFGSNLAMYPAAGAYKYYVNFWAENINKDPNLGPSPVKLHIDNLRDQKGTKTQTNKQFTVSQTDDTVIVTFDEVKCPRQFIDEL
ncbi:hypothetical protein BDV59DRAFT_206267 [Aspergillus ambiguus]|uniref:uncharacterized protein n=1 Tax=Aspergillus ambiguus TaxID=176160 RepID=UPI003CCD62B1